MTEQERMTAAEFRALVNATPTKPNKYGAIRCEEDGIKFDSKIERDRYLWWKATGAHIDAHPAFTLPGGIRYRADLMIHTEDRIIVEDVKGRSPGTDFKRIKRLFDAYHPLAPLVVVTRAKGEWRTEI